MRVLRFNALSEPVSPAHTGVLLAGDVVGDLLESGIEGLGALRNRVVRV